jgi:glyoxylase-like metal-dependent hydrolase (beta-lactamase superfamily II)
MNRTVAVRLAGVAIAAAALSVMWSQAPRPALTIEKVTDNLYVIFGSGGNVAVMPTTEGVILVDDKFAQDAPDIVAKVKTVSEKPIRYILNTHQHGDHTGGNQALMAASAEIVIHKNARANMVTNKQPGLPRITFSDETQLFLGGKEVRARHLGRGHTNGDALIYFPSERVLHTGDLFVNGFPFIDYANGGSLVEWDKTIERALEYDADKVIPGHGPVASKSDLVKWRQTLVTLRSRAAEACASGGTEAVKHLKLDDLGMNISPMAERSIPGICQELKR